MTVTSFYQQSLTYSASDDRKLNNLQWAGPDGVRFEAGNTPLLPQAQSTPDMSVRVPGGWAKKSGYVAFSDAVKTVAVPAANGANPRIDLVVVRWRDTENGDAASDADVVLIQGTPAASPTAPSTVGVIVQVLGEVFVAAGATSITGAAITDRRVLKTQNGMGVWQGSRAQQVFANNTTGDVPLDTKVIDTDTWGAPSGGGLVAVVSGIYEVSGRIVFPSFNGSRGLKVALNGNEIPDSFTLMTLTGGTNAMTTGRAEVAVATGQRLTLQALQVSGGTVTTSGAFLNVRRVA